MRTHVRAPSQNFTRAAVRLPFTRGCHLSLVFFLDDADSDKGEKDGGDEYDFDVGHDRACDLGAGDAIGGNVDQDDVSAVEVANMFCLFLKSARRQCALCIRFFPFECSEFMSIVAQLYQGVAHTCSRFAWIPSTRFQISRA